MTARVEQLLEELVTETRQLRELLQRQGRAVLSAREAAKLVRKAPKYVRALCDRGILAGKVGPGRYEIPREALDELVRRGLPDLRPRKPGRPPRRPRSMAQRVLALPLPERRGGDDADAT